MNRNEIHSQSTNPLARRHTNVSFTFRHIDTFLSHWCLCLCLSLAFSCSFYYVVFQLMLVLFCTFFRWIDKHFWRLLFVYGRFVFCLGFILIRFWLHYFVVFILGWCVRACECVQILYVNGTLYFGCKASNRTNLIGDLKNLRYCVCAYARVYVWQMQTDVCVRSFDVCLSNHQKVFLYYIFFCITHRCWSFSSLFGLLEKNVLPW